MTTSPLTGSTDVTQLESIATEQLVNDWQARYGIDISSELKGCQQIDLYQCNQTKLKYFSPSEATGSSRLYEQLQKITWYYQQHKWEYKVALFDLDRYQFVIEIGSGSGHFIEQALNAGINIQGIEINPIAVEEAQNKGLPVSLIELDEAAKKFSNSADGVCSFQVLEHIENPKEFITHLLTMIKPGGKLIFSVPNSEGYLKYEYNLLDMPPHHMLRWSKTTFQSLEQIFPIRLEKVLYEPLALYHVSGYVYAYSNYFQSCLPLRVLLFNRFTIWLYKFGLTLGLRKLFVGHTMYVQFRKLI